VGVREADQAPGKAPKDFLGGGLVAVAEAVHEGVERRVVRHDTPRE
jgi:hypothetical protein